MRLQPDQSWLQTPLIPHGYAPITKKLYLSSRILEAPIEPIKLNLAELKLISICVYKALHSRERAVSREAEMADPSKPLLLYEVIVNSILRIKISVNIRFGHRVEEIKIKVFNAASP